jgi:hypothetical protein
MDCENKQILDGYVYIDENDNGLREVNEKGIKNTIIELQDDSGKILQTTTTIDTGKYLFEVCPDNFKINVTYSQGENSYLDRYEATVSSDAITQDYNFKVIKGQQDNTLLYILLFVTILGTAAVAFTYKLLSKR